MVNWKNVGKIMFISGGILTILGYLWRELLLGGVHKTYVVYWVDFAWGVFLIGGMMWFLSKRKSEVVQQ